VSGILGSPPRSFRQWVADHVTAFTEGPAGEDDALVIAIAVCIDRIHEDEAREHPGRGGFGGF